MKNISIIILISISIADSCKPFRSHQEQIEMADVIFIGTVINSQMDNESEIRRSPDEKPMVLFEVGQKIKGEIADTIKVHSAGGVGKETTEIGGEALLKISESLHLGETLRELLGKLENRGVLSIITSEGRESPLESVEAQDAREALGWYGIIFTKANGRFCEIAFTDIRGAYYGVTVHECAPIIRTTILEKTVWG